MGAAPLPHGYEYSAALPARSAAHSSKRAASCLAGHPITDRLAFARRKPPTHLSTLAPHLPTHTPQLPANTHLQLAVTEVATMRSRTSGSVVNLSRRKPS